MKTDFNAKLSGLLHLLLPLSASERVMDMLYDYSVSAEKVKEYVIKELLRFCNIDRKVPVFDEDKGDNVYKPLYELASTKLCRKTHVDMMNKVQINMYAAGLHKDGSDAVERYTKLDIRDRFILMCAAFNQPLYKVDKDLNIID